MKRQKARVGVGGRKKAAVCVYVVSVWVCKGMGMDKVCYLCYFSALLLNSTWDGGYLRFWWLA
jgi:hypothetical protein